MRSAITYDLKNLSIRTIVLKTKYKIVMVDRIYVDAQTEILEKHSRG